MNPANLARLEKLMSKLKLQPETIRRLRLKAIVDLRAATAAFSATIADLRGRCPHANVNDSGPDPAGGRSGPDECADCGQAMTRDIYAAMEQKP